MNGELEVLFPKLMGPSDEEFAAAHEIVMKRNEAIEKQKRGTVIRCASKLRTGEWCDSLFRIGDAAYFKEMSLEPNTGSPNGSYRYESGGRVKCPHCGHMNRLHKNPELQKLRGFFKSVEEIYI